MPAVEEIPRSHASRKSWRAASAAATGLLLLLPAPSFCLSSSQRPSPPADFRKADCSAHTEVWDAVLSPSASDRLHSFASGGDGGDGGLSHRILVRGSHRASHRPLSPLERALDSILTALGDASSAVEYWTRREWRHIEAHADVDEAAARTDAPATHRHPRHGHVLYLQVGTEVRGPTAVFDAPRGVRSGADLAAGEDLRGGITLVPPAGGRLARFRGDALHAVPRPADLWFLPFVRGAAKYRPEEKFGRSVVLFNTWPSEGDVEADGIGAGEYPGGAPPLDVEEYFWKDGEEGACAWETGGAECNPGEEWRGVPVNHMDEGTSSWEEAKVWLLGDERRRGVPGRTVKILAEEGRVDGDDPTSGKSSASSLREALLHETSKVTRFQIRGL